MQTSSQPGFLEVLLRACQTSYVALLHTVHQGKGSRIKTSTSGSLRVGKLDCLFDTINIRPAVNAVLTPSSARRSRAAFFAMTVLAVMAATGGCPDKPGYVASQVTLRCHGKMGTP